MPELTTAPFTPTDKPSAPPRPLPANKDELYDGFYNLLASEKTSCAEVRDFPRAPEHLEGWFPIYPLYYLPSHSEIPHPEIDKPSTSDNKPLRYIINDADELWFAFNGRARNRVPYHTEIAPYSFSAGEVLINSENKICQINNDSGHFKPCWTRLIYLLEHLLSAPELLSETLNITALTGPENTVSFEIPVTELLCHFGPVHVKTPRYRARQREILRERHQHVIMFSKALVTRDLFKDLESAGCAQVKPSGATIASSELYSTSDSENTPTRALGLLKHESIQTPAAKRSCPAYTPLRSASSDQGTGIDLQDTLGLSKRNN